MKKYGEIEKGIPISNRTNAKYVEIAKQMEVDDSILFKTDKEATSLVNAIRLTHGKCINGTATVKAFAKRMEHNGWNSTTVGYRVWRIA